MIRIPLTDHGSHGSDTGIRLAPADDATGVDLTIDPETAAEEPIHRHLTPAEARALAACLMHFAQETTR